MTSSAKTALALEARWVVSRWRWLTGVLGGGALLAALLGILVSHGDVSVNGHTKNALILVATPTSFALVVALVLGATLAPCAHRGWLTTQYLWTGNRTAVLTSRLATSAALGTATGLAIGLTAVLIGIALLGAPAEARPVEAASLLTRNAAVFAAFALLSTLAGALAPSRVALIGGFGAYFALEPLIQSQLPDVATWLPLTAGMALAGNTIPAAPSLAQAAIALTLWTALFAGLAGARFRARPL